MLILVPYKFIPENIGYTKQRGHFAIIPEHVNAQPRVKEIALGKMTREERIHALQAMGLSQEHAQKVYNDTKGYLEPICRHPLLEPSDNLSPEWLDHWHTQGSGKTYTMIKAAELLFKAPESNKPTIMMMIDRNELEDQMLKNLAALGLHNVEHAYNIRRLNSLLKHDYRGIIVTTIHKFRDMPANMNERENIYVLIDEAHRTTGGDLGTYLMAGLPNATYIGFTGTPIDKTAYGKGTFKTFGMEDDKGYLHKYSIAESIADGTTLPLFYNLAPNEMRVPHDTLDQEFLSLAETQGIANIEELNKILDRAVNLKNFLKGTQRIDLVAKYVAEHYRENVEPLGYKAFLVAVDREACAHYKKALDTYLPPEYSDVVYTGNNNDSALLKEFHLDPKQERQYRVKTDKRSGIVNDPNRDDEPDYIVNLIQRVITVSVETVKIVKALPELEQE